MIGVAPYGRYGQGIEIYTYEVALSAEENTRSFVEHSLDERLTALVDTAYLLGLSPAQLKSLREWAREARKL